MFSKNNYRSVVLLFLLAMLCSCHSINRKAVVSRHNPEQTQIDSLSPFTVGNGEFAFTADLTGMQTFPEIYERGISLGTFSQWGWHSFPNTGNYQLNDVVQFNQVGERLVPYWYQFPTTSEPRKFEAAEWLRENPHRLHLGLIGLEILNAKGDPIKISELQNPKQQLNLWKGELTSTFEVEGIPVKVVTFCHQSADMVAFQIQSELIKTGKLKVKINYPYAAKGKFNTGYDFSQSEKHTTQLFNQTPTSVTVKRQLDAATYFSKITWSRGKIIQSEEHELFVEPSIHQNQFELCCSFTSDFDDQTIPTFEQTQSENETAWELFWESGGAVDFSGSTDPRAHELERRVVLSQYLTKIQCSGSLPPQETGLTTNSWFGKFHLEMHWWHAIHFILWNRADLIQQQLDYYFHIFNQAQSTAQFQGYEGVRWPKMTDPNGVESPSNVGTFLIWQQPHLIYFVELLSRNSTNGNEVRLKYLPLVEATADFMASYARWDSLSNRFVLGPALIPAQECFDRTTTINPVFELAYWKWGLQTAQDNRAKLGLPPNDKWQQVIDHLAQLPVADGRYLFTENATDSYSNPRYFTDHPIVLAIAGFLPISGQIDQTVMQKTFDTIISRWDWDTAWGWDFPLAAKCATVLDRPEQAVDLLLMNVQKNSYLLNGHNYQEERLPLYLPGNGALLSAVSMMCTYKNEQGGNGFSNLPGWKVRFENMGNSLHIK